MLSLTIHAKNQMDMTHYFKKFSLLTFIMFAAASFSLAQTGKSSAPRQEKLLNNMKLLVWSESAAEKATVKLRVHSGAAFDTQTKEGTMALLADILFPNESVNEFFSEELGGTLSIESNYDYLQITATGNPDKILTILETMATAVTKPTIDKETTAKVKAARLEKISELEKNPAYVADLAVAKRLFGNYPYGRSAAGTAASLAKIDFADILLAKQRFLTADNATLAVSGNIKPDYVFKAVRQLFGGWEKADRKVPATFAQPSAPDTKFFLIKSEINNASELRFAFRGAARRDQNFYAVRILTGILQNRLLKKDGDKVLLQENSYLLPGLVTVKFSDWDASSLKLAGADVSLPENFLNFVQDLLAANVTDAEFAGAKASSMQNYAVRNAVDAWLDADSYNLASLKIDAANAQNTTLADVQKVLEKWRREAVVRTLLLKSAA